MTKSKQPPAKMRKTPIQERSKTTIEAILDATTQLLATESVRALTTNHIAKRAGVSIGTLYQYFPNKNAVLLEVANRRRAATTQMVIDQLADVETGSVDDIVRQIIRAVIAIVAKSYTDKELTILMMILRLEGSRDVAPIDGVAAVIAAKLAVVMQVEETQSEAASFILTRAISNVVRTAALDAPHLLHEQEFEDQLVRLVTGFLHA